MTPTVLGREWSPHNILTNIIILSQTEELSDLAGPFGTQTSRNGLVGKAWDLTITCKRNDSMDDTWKRMLQKLSGNENVQGMKSALKETVQTKPHIVDGDTQAEPPLA